MATKTVLNVKTDAAVKKQAQQIAYELGVPLSIVVNAFLKEFVRSRRVTFAVEPRLRPEIEQLFEEAERDGVNGKNNSPAFADVDDAIAHLDKKAA